MVLFNLGLYIYFLLYFELRLFCFDFIETVSAIISNDKVLHSNRQLAENRHVMCVVEKAEFEPRTLGTGAERATNCATAPVISNDTSAHRELKLKGAK